MSMLSFIAPGQESIPRAVAPASGPAAWSSDVLVVARESRQPIRPPLTASPTITLPDCDAFPATIDLFGNASRIKRHYDESTHCAIYLLGHAASSSPLSEEALLRWCAAAALGSEPKALRDLHGMFVLIVDNRATGEVTFVSDVLGVRPWFIGQFNGRLVAGSNIRQLLAAGLTTRRVNYNAVACWLRFNHPCASLSVLDDYQGIDPATLSVHRPDGTRIRSAEWGRPEFGLKIDALDKIVDESFAASSESVRALVRGMPELSIPLSGGFDSRLVLALASRESIARLHLATVATSDDEVAVARQVAQTLGHYSQILPAGTHIINLFDDPFAFTPGGFITGRNLTSAIARRRRGVPVVSGFIGDDLLRGSFPAWRNDFYLMDSQNPSLDELAAVTEKRFAYEHHRMHLFRDSVRRRADQRARDELRMILRRGRDTGRPTTHTTMYCHERLYFANIVLQHLDIAEGMAPLCNYGTLNCRFRHHPACFDERNYPHLFRRHLPKLSPIPMGGSEPSAQDRRKPPPTRHLRRWSGQIAHALAFSDCLTGLQRRRLLKLLPSGLLGQNTYEKELSFVYKLLMFERSLREQNVPFDWMKI